jgi:hypothetical protein
MANQPHPFGQGFIAPSQVQAQYQQPAHGQAMDSELRITIWRDSLVFYRGTAAQLTDEGLIAKGFEWPRVAAEVCWAAGGLRYRLRRERPEGHKGPMRSWLELDNWFLRVEVEGRDFHWCQRRELERRAQELKEDAYKLTLAGRLKQEAEWNRYWATQKDKAYQAFRATVPALNPPKRARKSRPRSADHPEPSA